ncbi:hypothetical protein HG533_08785 [Moraxella osloensis]|jgi:hypothetical protein|nr:hypothetical protein [Moraxella osloensis]MBW4018891.1 hypothetical protein [Moraxella osloensis]
MIKRRTQETALTEQDFVNGVTANQSDEKPNLDPKAPRKFKSHTLPLNEYEYNLLVALADKYGQTHSGIIRYALKQLALKEN